MTTSLTVNAHAGWDIEVKVAEKTNLGWNVREVIVPKNTEQVFYIHSTMDIWGIKELPTSPG
jgi:hypothetical protein